MLRGGKPLRDTPHPDLPQSGEGAFCRFPLNLGRGFARYPPQLGEGWGGERLVFAIPVVFSARQKIKPLRDTPHPDLPQSGEGALVPSPTRGGLGWGTVNSFVIPVVFSARQKINPLRDTPHPDLPQSGEGAFCHSEPDTK